MAFPGNKGWLKDILLNDYIGESAPKIQELLNDAVLAQNYELAIVLREVRDCLLYRKEHTITVSAEASGIKGITVLPSKTESPGY